ncbi:MAG TPA: hypothetical protein VMT76_00905 [Puia sp.]|nr:hypothetical protein [Puia sp.]
MEKPESVYRKKIIDYSSQLERTTVKVKQVAMLRLGCFAALIFSIYYCATGFVYSLLMLTITLGFIFIFLVKSFFRLKDKKNLIEKLLFVNKNELDIITDKTNQFNNGHEYLASEGYFDDLDIFGKNSLYHLLNRTTTSHGAAALASLLKTPILSEKNILEQQQAIGIFSEIIDIRQLITAYGLLKQEKEGNLFNVLEWMKVPVKLKTNKMLQIIRWALPLFNISAIFFYLQTGNYSVLAVGIIASWAIISLFAKYINCQHAMISQKQKILNQYADILKIFGNINPRESVLLTVLHNTSLNAHRSIRQLSQLTSWFDQRLNMIVNVLLNSIFMYDIQCMITLEKWKEENKNRLKSYIDCVGQIESLNSLSCFAYNNQRYVYPNISRGGFIIETKQIAHPLIRESERIANDFSIGKENKLHLLTGSNMSGKTTFLRTIGINLLLAQCGSPVCAETFCFTPMNILTSIRVSDSLQEHTSYFMAELKRLKQIISQLETRQPALVLIDEILRGTNSEDKTHGSEEFVKRLLHFNCLSIFATHDLALSRLEAEFPGTVSNYCFESIIQNSELFFDYKLQKGVAKNKNASFLMKKMEII